MYYTRPSLESFVLAVFVSHVDVIRRLLYKNVVTDMLSNMIYAFNLGVITSP